MGGITISYDLVMLAVLVVVTIIGAWRGAVWQIASVAALIVSAFVAVRLSGPLAPMFGQDETWNRYAAMLAVYLVCSLGIWFLFRFVSQVIDKLRLKEFDRQIGALIGLVKGALLCGVITFFAVTLSEGGRKAVFNSYSGYYTSVVLHRATPILPEPVRNRIGQWLNDFNNKLPQQPPTAPDRQNPPSTLVQIPGPATASTQSGPSYLSPEDALRQANQWTNNAEQTVREYRQWVNETPASARAAGEALKQATESLMRTQEKQSP